MGSGVNLECDCGNQENIFLGIGMLFPLVYEETVAAIRNGDYGEEWQKLLDSKEYVGVDAYNYLCYCEECGHWHTEKGLDLYEPKDVERVKEELVKKGELSYLMDFEIKEFFHLMKRYNHTCPNCNVPMKKTRNTEHKFLSKIACEKCGKTMKRECGILWD